MRSNRPLTAAALWLALAGGAAAQFRGVLVSAAQLGDLKKDGPRTVVLNLDANAGDAARRIRAAGFELYYWIEVGRNPAMAEAHPEWMASLQGHPEWRRFFPTAPQPGPGAVVKNYPWVPVLYRESFDAHLGRVAALLKDVPAPEGIFLNDLQGAPSACGCGNILCRWTTDYGPIRTATRLGPEAAAQFAAAVARLAPQARIIPVWTTECEEHDKAERCGGVGCFTGACWVEYTKQFLPLAAQCETLAVLAPYRAFGRDAGWVKRSIESFQPRGIAADRLIAVVEDGDSSLAGAAGRLVSRMKIAQDWQPRIVETR